MAAGDTAFAGSETAEPADTAVAPGSAGRAIGYKRPARHHRAQSAKNSNPNQPRAFASIGALGWGSRLRVAGVKYVFWWGGDRGFSISRTEGAYAPLLELTQTSRDVD